MIETVMTAQMPVGLPIKIKKLFSVCINKAYLILKML